MYKCINVVVSINVVVIAYEIPSNVGFRGRAHPSALQGAHRQISTILTYSKFYFNAGRNLPGYPKHVQNVMAKADQNPLQVLEFRPATMWEMSRIPSGWLHNYIIYYGDLWCTTGLLGINDMYHNNHHPISEPVSTEQSKKIQSAPTAWWDAAPGGDDMPPIFVLPAISMQNAVMGW